MADLPEEIQGKLQSGYSLCHPEDDCAGQRAWLKVSGELELLREEIERLRGEIEGADKYNDGAELEGER